jgi:HAD superfamily hydrolase (TIGR01490 family)
MDLALFDFDGTITDRETMPAFMHVSVRPTRLTLGKLLLAPVVIGYKLGLVSGSIVRAAICWFGFRGVSAAEVEQHGLVFAREYLPKVLRPEAMERIAWHQARGDKVVLVSGGLDVYLSHWAEAHGLDLICSSLEREHGRLTGRYRGAQCVRAEKAQRVQAAYPANEFGRIFAYGDTPEDHELLAMAHEPYYRWQPAPPAVAGGR